jgi:integrase
MGGYVTAKCRCDGCRQWAREYRRNRMRERRAAAAGVPGRRWAKSRDADESYLDEVTWNRIWTTAVKASGIPFKPTAYQMRHTHASWQLKAPGRTRKPSCTGSASPTCARPRGTSTS